MDTLGAIVGPLTALGLLVVLPGNYRTVFAVTVLPGLVAAALIGLVVQEKKRAPVPHASFTERLALLPSAYRRLLVAVGIFGAGAFAHTLLILLATQRLTPGLGASGAASAAVALYVLHNVFYAGFSYLGPSRSATAPCCSFLAPSSRCKCAARAFVKFQSDNTKKHELKS